MLPILMLLIPRTVSRTPAFRPKRYALPQKLRHFSHAACIVQSAFYFETIRIGEKLALTPDLSPKERGESRWNIALTPSPDHFVVLANERGEFWNRH